MGVHGMERCDSGQSIPAVRTSKRRKRSELSPSSKATHSIIEKERREAMNEKFSELASNIPELVEAIAAGKRPTKGEIVKASIARHQDQERRVRELMHEVQMLRSGSNGASTPNSFSALETPSPLTSVAPEPVLSTPQLSMPYQVQASHPIGLSTSTAQGNLWVGHLLDKSPASLSFDAPPTMPLLPDLGQQPVSPFKQSSMMNWNLSSYPTPLDPSSLSIALPTSNFMKSFLDASTLDHFNNRRGSDETAPTSTSGFSSPTFSTSSDSNSSFSTDVGDERRFLAESMAFEPFAMATSNVVEQTPLTSLVGLPAMGEMMGKEGKGRRISVRRGRKEGVKQEEMSSPLTASRAANV